MNLLEAITARRSLGLWSDQALDRQLVEQLLGAAITAPNHHDSQPWRFFVLAGEARGEFGDVLADALIRRSQDISAEKLPVLAAAERAKPLRAPLLIVVGCKHSENPRILPEEDRFACAAAAQNILLAADSQGLAAQWKTGEGIRDTRVKAHFGLEPQDDIVAVLYIGFPSEGARDAVKPRDRSFETVTEWRN